MMTNRLLSTAEAFRDERYEHSNHNTTLSLTSLASLPYLSHTPLYLNLDQPLDQVRP